MLLQQERAGVTIKVDREALETARRDGDGKR
jgi:hypothetical protein